MQPATDSNVAITAPFRTRPTSSSPTSQPDEPSARCHPERSAKDPRRPGRELSIGTPKILRLTPQDDKRQPNLRDDRLAEHYTVLYNRACHRICAGTGSTSSSRSLSVIVTA